MRSSIVPARGVGGGWGGGGRDVGGAYRRARLLPPTPPPIHPPTPPIHTQTPTHPPTHPSTHPPTIDDDAGDKNLASLADAVHPINGLLLNRGVPPQVLHRWVGDGWVWRGCGVRGVHACLCARARCAPPNQAAAQASTECTLTSSTTWLAATRFSPRAAAFNDTSSTHTWAAAAGRGVGRTGASFGVISRAICVGFAPS